MTIRAAGDHQFHNDEYIKHVCNAVQSDQWKSSQEISVETGISVTSIHNILHEDMDMLYICETWFQKC
jgi:hypothetical protein